MTVRFSTGLRNNMLDSSGIKESFTDGVLRVYSGAQPSSADDAVQGTLLLEITVDSGAFAHGTATNGLEFDAPVSGVLSKAAAETWSGNGLADGTAGWCRLSGNPLDDGTSSTTLPRIDANVAKSGGDVNLSNPAVTTSAPVTVDIYSITLKAE